MISVLRVSDIHNTTQYGVTVLQMTNSPVPWACCGKCQHMEWTQGTAPFYNLTNIQKCNNNDVHCIYHIAGTFCTSKLLRINDRKITFMDCQSGIYGLGPIT